ncbi:MAG: hypothetical protein ACW992_03880 [Candidatus Thorarchaeota archaeon]|jgi:hypothetical protein
MQKKRAEELVLTKSREIGLEEYEGVVIQAVEIEFEEVSSPRRRIWHPIIDDQGVLKIRLRDTDLNSGVKLYFATTAKEMEFDKEIESYRSFFIYDFFIPIMYPLIILVLSLFLLYWFDSLGLLYTITVGPVLFTVMVLPASVWGMRQRNERERLTVENIRYRLELTSFFSSMNEVVEYALLVTKGPAFQAVFDLIMYLVNLPFLIMLVLGFFV